jgi:hypothetical protein
MKTKKYITPIFLVFLAITSCNNAEQKKEESPKVDTVKVYACPMHPDEKGDKESHCPECGMCLEEVKK